MNMNPPIVLDRDGISILGKREILLCASLFYFRIPLELWHDRIRKLKMAGYNCADVYFPWNFHELSPGEWTFEADRDVDAFLTIMAEEDIHVVARPGPYICSEWDGGSIPGWLLADGTEIRSDNPVWLSAVRDWYSRIIPILSRHQIHKKGSIILLQVENELDFFDCPNPGSYMAKLAAMAREFGIEVPVFGCAGQGSVEGATGWADDVVPTFNFYPSVFNPDFDPVCLAVHKALQEKNLPFLITETGREHFLLRREMANGARLLGAYNQVGGTNFGFTTSINNWGKGGEPLSFLTTDYDFDSMIDAGGRFRTEALEGRLLGGLLEALGEPLATAVICDTHECAVTWTDPHEKNKGNGNLLDMGKSGALLCIPNFSDKTEEATVTSPAGSFKAVIGAYHAPFFPLVLDLSKTGIAGILVHASAEVLKLSEGEIILYAENIRETTFQDSDDSTGGLPAHAAGAPEALFQAEDGIRTCISGFGRHEVVMGGRILQVKILDRETAQRIDIGRGAMKPPVSVRKSIVQMPVPAMRKVFPESEWMTPRKGSGGIHMEACGLARGTATYRVVAKAGSDLLLKGAADIMQGWCNHSYQGCRVSGGQWQFYPHAKGLNPSTALKNENTLKDMTDSWQFRTDSWGHSNFDDGRLPSMRIAAPKGIGGLFQVNRIDMSGLMWRFRIRENWLPDILDISISPMDPILSPNDWNSTRMPLISSYSIQWTMSEDSDACALEMSEPEAETAAYVDGRLAGVINAFDPWLDLGGWFQPGQTRTISLLCRKRHWAEPAGVPKMYHLTILYPEILGYSDRDLEQMPFWDCKETTCSVDNKKQWSDSPYLFEKERMISLRRQPALTLVPGESLMLQYPLDNQQTNCLNIRIKGREMKATGIFNGHLLGRIFGKSACRPAMVGGDAELLYMPGPWFREMDNVLILIVEGIGEGALLESVWLEP